MQPEMFHNLFILAALLLQWLKIKNFFTGERILTKKISDIHLKNENLVLRDHLAADRTILANERTLLAYIRTALAIFISGLSLIKLFESITLQIMGWVFMSVALLTSVIGAIRYVQVDRAIRPVSDSSIVSEKN